MSHSQNNPTEHISLLHRYISVVPYLLPKDGDLLSSFLWHIDLRTPNIFVNDNGNITSLIDWQSTWAGPLFFEARHPYFLNYNGELLLELPEDFKQLDEDTQTVVKDQVTRSILLYLYEKYTAERNPLLSRVLQYPNGMIMTDPVRFVGSTWDEDILPLRKSLIRVQKKWELLDHTVHCPINFSLEEIRRHYEDGEGWNEVQDFGTPYQESWAGMAGRHMRPSIRPWPYTPKSRSKQVLIQITLDKYLHPHQVSIRWDSLGSFDSFSHSTSILCAVVWL